MGGVRGGNKDTWLADVFVFSLPFSPREIEKLLLLFAIVKSDFVAGIQHSEG